MVLGREALLFFQFPEVTLTDFWTKTVWQPAVGEFGIWPLIMGLTMWLQMKLNPTPQDPIQAKMFMLMPIIFTFILAPFPAGLVIYWTCNNVLTIAQQWLIMRRTEARTARANG